MKKFRLTGTNSTMTMLKSIMPEDTRYGPSSTSGPLGGDAQVSALMALEDLGGCIFFMDPLTAHPHQVDIVSLIRLANVHNILAAYNPTSGEAIIEVLKQGLENRALIPSFYETLASPSVEEYKNQQRALVAALSEQRLDNPKKEESSKYCVDLDAAMQSNNLRKLTPSGDDLKVTEEVLVSPAPHDILVPEDQSLEEPRTPPAAEVAPPRQTHCSSAVEKWDSFESNPNTEIDISENGAVAEYRASDGGWAWQVAQTSRCVPQCGQASGTIKIEKLHPLHIGVMGRNQAGKWKRLFAYYAGGQVRKGNDLCSDCLPGLRTGSVVTVSLDSGVIIFQNGDKSAALKLDHDAGDIALSVTLWQNASVRLL